MKSMKAAVKTMHWDTKKGKPAWHYIVPSILAGVALVDIVLYKIVTLILCFVPDAVNDAALALIGHSYDQAYALFGISGGVYGIGSLANAITKGGEVYGTTDTSLDQSVPQKGGQ